MKKTDLFGVCGKPMADPTQQDVISNLDNNGNPVIVATTSNADEEMSVIHDSLELTDPTPDILTLFEKLNTKFFWGKLTNVTVKWCHNPWMVRCSGKSRFKHSDGSCKILLSELLLKYRPRKDLVEALLHEMIHAYISIHKIQDDDSHGQEFCKHLSRINQMARCNIPIKHKFHKEVEVYRALWWRCDGPCQDTKPFFGYRVKPEYHKPSSPCQWKSKEGVICGGQYVKVPKPDYGFLRKKKIKKVS